MGSSVLSFIITVSCLSSFSVPALAGVATGDRASAKRYFHVLSKRISFSAPDKIEQTTLDDVAAYLGYDGLTGRDMQDLPSKVLMSQDLLLAPEVTLGNREKLSVTVAAKPIGPDDVLVSRFFAPKIMNIREPEATRKLGWRKLVRLVSRPGSPAEANHIRSGIILFNFFTDPGVKPFLPGTNSVNTQVMLVLNPTSVANPGGDGQPTLYWLDYDTLEKGGKLSLALNASFDARDLQPASGGTRPYFVPDGCVACHGESANRSLVNYLDTDHWYDRLDTDFNALKATGQPLLVDAESNDPNDPTYQAAFDVIRRFNREADAQVHLAQPNHDEALASAKWLELHLSTAAHINPTDRSIGAELWSGAADDRKMLDALNTNCFRCHGTVRFSVFNKKHVRDRHIMILDAIRADAKPGLRMPPDRDLDTELRDYLTRLLPSPQE